MSDHGFYDPAASLDRSALRWPGGRPLAFAIVLCAEDYRLAHDASAYAPVNVPGMFGRGPYPDIGSFARREYGNRVGFFRVARLLDGRGLRATAAVDARVAARCPAVLRESMARGWPTVGHGRSVNDIISSRMTEGQEAAYISECLQALESASGGRVAGWHGAEYGESASTPRLLAQAGVQYLLDWPNDEQPFYMRTGSAPILSIPMNADFDDVNAMWHRKLQPVRWAEAILDAVERLASDGRDGGRVYVLNLHAWLIGHPFRAAALDDLLGRLRRRDDVWFTTTQEIAQSCRDQLPAPPAETPE